MPGLAVLALVTAVLTLLVTAVMPLLVTAAGATAAAGFVVATAALMLCYRLLRLTTVAAALVLSVMPIAALGLALVLAAATAFVSFAVALRSAL